MRERERERESNLNPYMFIIEIFLIVLRICIGYILVENKCQTSKFRTNLLLLLYLFHFSRFRAYVYRDLVCLIDFG